MSMTTEETYPEFNYEEVLRETTNAIQFDIDGDGKRKVWIPKSEIEHYEDEKSFTIPRWLAVKKELI